MDTGLAGKGVLVRGASGGIGSCVRAEVHRRGRAQVDLLLFTRARETLGTVAVCAAVAGVWPSERNGHGSLVLVGSTAGRFGEAGHAEYAAADGRQNDPLLD